MSALRLALALAAGAVLAGDGHAQTPPSASDVAAYTGLLAAAAHGDVSQVRYSPFAGTASWANELEARDGNGRTPLLVAAHRGDRAFVEALARKGADMNATDNQRYDIITIAAVRDEVDMVKLAIKLGASAKSITSPYDGTALIAAAHLGHSEVVRALIAGGAPLDHVNNLGWTAAIEAVVLGDGGPRHQATLKALIDAGANMRIGDRDGVTPLEHAKRRGYRAMVDMLENSGTR